MKKFDFDRAEKIFVNYLGGELVNIDKHGFSRQFEFTAEGVKYNVIWFHNQSSLICGGLEVMFHDVEISNTWPSPAGAKRKLQFRDASGDCVAVIVLERH